MRPRSAAAPGSASGAHPGPNRSTARSNSRHLSVTCRNPCRTKPPSAVDDGHVPLVVALAGGRREVVQPFDLLGAQLHAVSGGILLDAGDPLGAGNRGDV